MRQPSKIVLEYDNSNEKWYVFVDDVWIGKHYNIEEALKEITRYLR